MAIAARVLADRGKTVVERREVEISGPSPVMDRPERGTVLMAHLVINARALGVVLVEMNGLEENALLVDRAGAPLAAVEADAGLNEP
jgi:hypothetical protein